MDVYLEDNNNALEIGRWVINRITSTTTNTHKGGEATAAVITARSHANVAKFLILEEEKVSQSVRTKSW